MRTSTNAVLEGITRKLTRNDPKYAAKHAPCPCSRGQQDCLSRLIWLPIIQALDELHLSPEVDKAKKKELEAFPIPYSHKRLALPVLLGALHRCALPPAVRTTPFLLKSFIRRRIKIFGRQPTLSRG